LAEEWADTELVDTQQCEQDRFHARGAGISENKRRNSAPNTTRNERGAAVDSRRSGDWASLTMQSNEPGGDLRNTSRTMRLIALRVTARGASRFATTTPKRAWPSTFGRR